MTFRIRGVDGVAVRPPARHQPAGRGAVRDRRRTATRWPMCATNARGQPDAPAARRHPGERQPAHPVHDGRHERAGRRTCTRARRSTAARRTCRVDGQKYVALRRRGLGGPVVLQQPDLHRGRRARRWSPASSRRRNELTISTAPRGNARRLSAIDCHDAPCQRTAPDVQPSNVRPRPRRRVPAALAARAAAALRRPRRRCCSRVDHFLVGRADDPRTIVVDAEVDAQARQVFKAARGREPNAEELYALRRVWLDNEVLYREGLALQVDKGDTAIRERVIFKALSVVDASVKLPPLDDKRAARVVRAAIARSTTSRRATTSRRPCCRATAPKPPCARS